MKIILQNMGDVMNGEGYKTTTVAHSWQEFQDLFPELIESFVQSPATLFEIKKWPESTQDFLIEVTRATALTTLKSNIMGIFNREMMSRKRDPEDTWVILEVDYDAADDTVDNMEAI